MRTLPLALNSFAAALCIMIGTQRAQAQALLPTGDIPQTVSYQGLLTSADGVPVYDGEYRITLALYADPTGTIKVWEDTYNTPITDGIFNVYLGSGNMRLPDPATMNRPLWVGIRLDDSAPMYPLTPLSASPYALNVPDRAITTGKLADGAVTAEKVDMDYIAGIAVNGQPVAAKGSLLNIEGSSDIALTYNDETNTIRLSRPTPATSGDNEKGTSALANQDQVWSANGDGWDIGANTTYTPVSGDWIGTSSTSGETFVLKTNSQTAMRYQPNGAATPNIVGGQAANSITAASIGSVIAGGGNSSSPNTINNDADHATIGGGSGNIASADHATIGGGHDNDATAIASTIGGGYDHLANAWYTTIGGGYNDSATALYATVGGGRQNLAADTGTFVGGGYSNRITSGTNYSVIGGGFSNQILLIDEEVNFAFLGGGNDNSISGYAAVIGGGEENTASNLYAVVGGGEENTASNLYAVVGGGLRNITSGHSAAIAGGQTNLASGNAAFVGAGHSDTASGGFSVVTGGRFNVATHDYSMVGGGIHNSAINDFAFIGGGDSNVASGRYSTIGGGYDHIASGSYSTVGGGDSNVASGNYSTATGGYRNSASGDYSTASGGAYHIVTGNYSTIAGGAGNFTKGVYATIGGGELNVVDTFSTIAGGHLNYVAGHYSTIGGGDTNTVMGDYATIGGGSDNNADANYTTVAGGRRNTISGIYSTIGGGYNNSITGTYAVIGGGDEHLASALNTTIAGGWDHTASGSFSTVGGGRRNVAAGNLSVIPGGDSLQTNSYAQTAVGFYNAPRTTGNISARPTAAANALNNNPIFMVGNGGSGAAVTRSNAFEVSYNGHSTVYGTNNIANTVATPTIYGATYTDNILYAWGDIGINAGGFPIPNGVFGVQNIARLGIGIYQITITVVDPVTNAPVFLDDASIVATLVAENPEEFPCGTIAVTRLDGQNRFKVCTKNAACQAVDLPFMFHLTGRNRL